MKEHGLNKSLSPSLCVLLGASTGGPAALVEVLKNIQNIHASCVMIVQHLDEILSSNLAAWLSEETGFHVWQPKKTYQPKQGDIVLLAGEHWQMNEDQCLKVCDKPLSGIYFMPSIDLLMHSMVKYWAYEAKGVLLTGMGKDGAEGLLAMRQKGWKTYAQHEKDCMLYGMPKEAASIDAADMIQSLQDIGRSLSHSIQYNALSHKER